MPTCMHGIIETTQYRKSHLKRLDEGRKTEDELLVKAAIVVFRHLSFVGSCATFAVLRNNPLFVEDDSC